ncbi:lipopolysaccharide biosynthesis protein [Spirosoma spitsbergense]|uniref:lipopolysaccharide biosynthesis protein n=1 Tax=Spirosoma spitsbergense TaxID=431554 RepID=UPI0003A2D2D3|nr:polysaccharide biosynthesis C-terminal domain-containing protein [Spirosoma spitsbergense]
MSVTKRLISGTASSWVRIAVTMLTQVLLVPVFLSYWDIKTYGIWLAVQALVNVFSTLDRGFNDYLQFEIMQMGHDRRDKVATLLWSGISTVAIVSCLEFIVLGLIVFKSNINFLFDNGTSISQAFLYDVRWTLMIQWTAWTLTNGVGLLIRALYSFGYFSRMGWWNVGFAIVTSSIPIVAIINGAMLVEACVWTLIGTTIILIVQLFDISYLLRKENISISTISLRLGFSNYYTSIALSGRYFLENFRQQGVRLLLSPLAGASGLAAFSTMRTGANVALQGISTITYPLMPDLMRFLKNKDQSKMQVAFDTIWLVVLIILSPAVLVAQTIAPYLFALWTKEQITYDPYLFAILSLSVLVYGFSQPATAIITGNNLLKVQVKVSLVSSLIVILGMLILIPIMGLIGVGISLLVAEVVVAIGFQFYAKKWLMFNEMFWPSKAYFMVFNSLAFTAIGMLLICTLSNYKWIWLIGVLLIQFWNVNKYWKNLPDIAIEKVRLSISRIPFLGKYYSNLVKI